MTNMPFNFPDPSVATRVQNPTTLEWWIYVSGVWELEEDTPYVAPTPSPTPSGSLNQDIADLRAEIAPLKPTIISLEAEISAAAVNNCLILE